MPHAKGWGCPSPYLGVNRGFLFSLRVFRTKRQCLWPSRHLTTWHKEKTTGTVSISRQVSYFKLVSYFVVRATPKLVFLEKVVKLFEFLGIKLVRTYRPLSHFFIL